MFRFIFDNDRALLCMWILLQLINKISLMYFLSTNLAKVGQSHRPQAMTPQLVTMGNGSAVRG